MIRALVESLAPGEAGVWEDEADVDLNPRIGPDWMLPGRQREVVTPGKNVKRYVACAMDARTDRLTWVTGRRKDSGLFIELLKKLLKVHADKKLVHVILDNYAIHSSTRTRVWLAEFGGRIRLHFLPPYCPDDNRIERKVFREMHANVTCNHAHPTIGALLRDVTRYLAARNRRLRSAGVAELREAI
jgi:DDE superfamily endonuclease